MHSRCFDWLLFEVQDGTQDFDYGQWKKALELPWEPYITILRSNTPLPSPIKTLNKNAFQYDAVYLFFTVRGLPDRDPPGQRPPTPGQRPPTPWTETPWTETPFG